MAGFKMSVLKGLLVAVVAVSGAARPLASDGFVLHLFDNATGALCLDGTPGGYYQRPGLSESWMIELEGGGWCVNEADCLSRSKTDIGSSKSWPPTGCPGMDGGSNVSDFLRTMPAEIQGIASCILVLI